MAGTLYLCATPIGNLEDMTYRAVRILQEVDLIAAEDTRNSLKLLHHFDITTPMTSYHEFNKIEKAHTLIGMLKEGKNIAVITDAGTPGISDPGEELVAMCYEEGITVTAVPGAAACITAVTSSGQPCRRFSFEAFLPKDKKERARVLGEMQQETRTMIVYEAPHHLRATLQELYEALNKPYIKGLTLTGGNPLDNAPEILYICRAVKEKFPTKDIWLYSGYTFEQIQELEIGVHILEYIDVLVDGPYIDEQRNITLHWVGSSNQRLINVPETLKQGKIITLQND